MGADGTRGPQPWTQFRVTTNFCRIPTSEWVHVTRGMKEEFRTGLNTASLRFQRTELPTPVVAYRVTDLGYDSQMMVLLDMWKEPVGSISPESLAREGFETLAEFRRYWMRRTRAPFEPLKEIMVYRVRPWREGDAEECGLRLMRKLYGEHLPA